MRTAVGVIVGIALATVAGCGGGEAGEEPGEPGFAGLTSCLAGTDRVNEVVVLRLSVASAGGEADGETPSPAGKMIAPQASNGLEYTLGGPTDKDGTISELPLLIFEVFEFEDERTAERRVEQLRSELRARIKRAGGQDRQLPVPRDVRAVGRVAVVHSVASLSSEPPDVTLDTLDEEGLAELTSCLDRSGYPPGPISAA